jgi:HEAT repeat protein
VTFEAVRDRDAFVRQEAAGALLATHNPEAIKRLALLATDGNVSSEVRRSAGRAFGPPSNPHVTGYKADPCVMDSLIILTDHTVATVRNGALSALGPMLDPCAIPPLIAALRDANGQVGDTARLMLDWYPDEPRVQNALRQ